MGGLKEFYELERALKDRGKKTLDTGNLNVPLSGKPEEKIQRYDFDAGAIIRRTVRQHSSVDVRVSGFPDCEHKPMSALEENTEYFVLDGDGKFVGRIIDAMNVIAKCTGIHLSKSEGNLSSETLNVNYDVVAAASGYRELCEKVSRNTPADIISPL